MPERQPLPTHVPFHKSTAFERMLFGAWGSGKTYAIIDEAIAWCLEHPGIRGLICRKTVPELRDTTEPIFKERMPFWDADKVRKTGGHLESYTFPNGSVLLFRSLDDWQKHKSLNVAFIVYDECNEIDEDTYLGMLSRVRQRDLTAEARQLGYTGEITRRGVWGATNPSGHDWLYYRFHPESPQREPDCEAFMSTTLDNPFLPPETVEKWLQMPKQWVMRNVFCQFDDFSGRIYEEWGWDTHVIKPIRFAERPVVWMAMDPGTDSPTAGLWCWNDIENRRLVGIAEYELPNLAADVHAAEWRKIEAAQKMLVRWRVSDPNAITQRSRETLISLQTAYAKMGFSFGLGAGDEDTRIWALGRLIHLRRFVVTEDCPLTFEAIRDYQWKDLSPSQKLTGEHPKQRPLKKNDHLVNCAQFLSGRDVPMSKIPKPIHPNSFQDDIHRTIRRQLNRKRLNAQRGNHDLGSIVV